MERLGQGFDGASLWQSADATANKPKSASPSQGWSGGRSTEPSAALRSRLSEVIEGEIIPRLMLSHRPPRRTVVDDAPKPSIDEIVAFARLVISPDLDAATEHVRNLRLSGMSAESLCLDLLAPTARCLGELWEEDLCDFLDVTVGLSRLQCILQELTPYLGPERGDTESLRRILLLPAPHETHTFGIAMVEKFFRASGWDVAGGAGSSADLAVDLVRAEWFGIAGFSVSTENHLDAVGACIRATRRASCNPAISVIVGGPLFVDRPDLAVLLGADALAGDGVSAVLMAQSLLDLKARA
ncbi:MAG: cobalamin B12-binding domain-containing protein [Alsobacter sp.]